MTGEKKKEIWRVVKFVLFSASAGIIQIGLFTLLNELCKWSYWPCYLICLLYTSPSPRDTERSRMPSSA